MNTEQRIEQIRERLNSQGDSQVYGDIDFLLSLVESQEAGGDPEDRVCVACGKPFWNHACDRPPLSHKCVDATSMRSRCVEKVKAMGQKRREIAGGPDAQHGPYGYNYSLTCAEFADEVVKELESVTLQEQETRQS